MEHYILGADGEPVVEPNVIAWAIWYETADRRIAETRIGGVRVSTVFLGLDHRFGDGPPILWETMIFDGPLDGYQERYASAAEARVGHAHAVMLVRDA
jgi:hypothetical protein